MLAQKLVFSCEKRHTNNWYKLLFWAPLSREKKKFVLIPLGAFWMVRPKAHCLLFEVCLTSDFHFQNSSKHSREKLRTFACINTQGNWHLKLLVGLSWCGQNLCVNFLWVLFPLPRGVSTVSTNLKNYFSASGCSRVDFRDLCKISCITVGWRAPGHPSGPSSRPLRLFPHF